VARDPAATRDRLVSAAEARFAADGIETASLRGITRDAGCRNAVALQYHFDDRAGMVRAVIQKHAPDIHGARHEMLDQWESGERSLSDAVAALVLPLAAKLDDPDGGRAFLAIHADLLDRPLPMIGPGPGSPNDSVHRWRGLVAPLIQPEAVRVHRRFAAIVHSAVELGRRARDERTPAQELFVSNLVDVTTAMLAAPLSPDTLGLLARRRQVGTGPGSRSKKSRANVVAENEDVTPPRN